ncbi:MAG TPA: hypothetical protein V6C97_33510 [Oculatellaceae cyanobacterium]
MQHIRTTRICYVPNDRIVDLREWLAKAAAVANVGLETVLSPGRFSDEQIFHIRIWSENEGSVNDFQARLLEPLSWGCSTLETIERLCKGHIGRVIAWCEGVNRWFDEARRDPSFTGQCYGRYV